MSEKTKYVFSEDTRRRNNRKTELIGSKGKDKQRARHARGRIKAVVKGIAKGDIATAINKADTIETIKRVGDYKAAAKKKQDYKPPSSHRK